MCCLCRFRPRLTGSPPFLVSSCCRISLLIWVSANYKKPFIVTTDTSGCPCVLLLGLFQNQMPSNAVQLWMLKFDVDHGSGVFDDWQEGSSSLIGRCRLPRYRVFAVYGYGCCIRWFFACSSWFTYRPWLANDQRARTKDKQSSKQGTPKWADERKETKATEEDKMPKGHVNTFRPRPYDPFESFLSFDYLNLVFRRGVQPTQLPHALANKANKQRKKTSFGLTWIGIAPCDGWGNLDLKQTVSDRNAVFRYVFRSRRQKIEGMLGHVRAVILIHKFLVWSVPWFENVWA